MDASQIGERFLADIAIRPHFAQIESEGFTHWIRGFGFHPKEGCEKTTMSLHTMGVIQGV
jgi:hypothetical protein